MSNEHSDNDASVAQTRGKALRTSKNAAMLLAGTMTRMIASFAFVLYSAALLGVEGFGKFSIAVHYFELFLSLCASGIAIMLTRDVARWPKRANRLLASALTLVACLCCFASPLMLLIGWLFGYSSDTLVAMMIGCVALFPAAFSNVLEAIFVARERAEFVTLGTAIESTLRIVLSFTVLGLGYGVVHLMLVLVVVRCVLMCSYVAGLRKLGPLAWDLGRPNLKRFVWRWRVFAAENWMATIYTNLDVVVLSGVAGEAAVGLYSAAWKFVRLGSVVAKSFTTAVYPVMSRMYAESQESFRRLYRHTIRAMCALALPAVIGVTILTDRIVDLLYTDEYANAAPVLRILIWVLLLEFLNPFLSHVLFAQGRQHRSMMVAAISLALNGAATYLLVARFGAAGAAMGCVLGGLVATVCYLMFAMSWREMLTTGGVVLRVLLAAVGMGAVLYLFREASWPVIGVLCLVVYGGLLFAVQALRVDDLRYFKSTFLVRAAT